jgi:radical SAM superfamily enzyme YgiQ (UPF0313 family)
MTAPTKARICLIWPPGFLLAYSIPLPFALLKSNLERTGCEVKILDCVLNGWSADSPALLEEIAAFGPDMVGVSTWSPMFPEAAQILAQVKALDPAIITALGGPHATTYYQSVMAFPQVDYAFRGEAEHSFARFVEGLQAGTLDPSSIPGLVYREDGSIRENPMDRPELDSLAPPDFEAIRLGAYNRRGYRWNSPKVNNAPLWVTRGCPYRCQYCSSPTLNGREIRKHGIEYMMSQIRRLYAEQGVRWFNIIDDNFTFDVTFAKEFCRALIALRLEGAGFGTPNGIRMSRGDPELWALMKEAGWRHLIIAPESGSQHTLQLMKKDLQLGIVPKKVAEIKAAGLKVQAFFIVGYPGETPAGIEETFRLILRCRFNFVFLANFHPLPGTPIYLDLVTRGEIRDGLLPENFSDGLRTYTPPELRNFNFAAFFFRTHLMMLLTNPRNIPYHLQVVFRQYPPGVISRKLAKTAMSLFFPRRKRKHPRHAWPEAMNFAAQNLFRP